MDNSLRRNLINSSSSNLSLKPSGETAHKDSTVASLQEKAAKNAEELHHAAASSDDDDEHASEHHLHQQTTAAAKSKFMITDILSGRRDAADVPLFPPPSEFPQNLSVRCRGPFGAADPALLHHRLMSAGMGAGMLLPPPPLHLFSPLHPAGLTAGHHLVRPGLSPGGSNSPAPSDHSSGEDTGHDTDSGLPGENSSVCSNGEYRPKSFLVFGRT